MVGGVASNAAVVDASDKDDNDREVVVGEAILTPYQPLPPELQFQCKVACEGDLGGSGTSGRGCKDIDNDVHGHGEEHE